MSNDRTGTGHPTSRSIAFYRKWTGDRPYVIATTRTEDPEAPIELVRPYSDGSGDEVLVSLTVSEWAELVGFIREQYDTKAEPKPTSQEGNDGE